MSRLRIHCFSISLDGYGAGPCQDLENPFGTGGLALHEWMRRTRTFQQIIGEGGGATGIEDDLVKLENDNGQCGRQMGIGDGSIQRFWNPIRHAAG